MADPRINSSNNHYYQVVNDSNAIFNNVLTSSTQLTYRGLTGYLATATSEQEQNFIASLLPSGPIWFFIGGSDSAQEGIWRWVSGPENGTLLSAGYTKWSPTEPNGGTSENALIINDLANFGWADITSTQVLPVNSVTKGYIVEYGGMPTSYSISPSTTSVNEGNSATFTINTKNIEWGKTISYSISGISQSDLSSGSLNGTAVVNQNGVDGQATVTIGLLADQLTEGTEYLTLNVAGTTSTVSVIDTSTTPQTTTPTSLYWMPSNFNDSVNGSIGLDTLIINSVKNNFSISSGSLIIERSTGYSVKLNSIERVKFSDTFVALDLSGNAGKAVSILGAVIGRDSLANKSVVGIALKIYDANSMTDMNIARLALDSVLGPNASDKSVVNLLYKNLVGVLPDPLSEGLYVSMIKNGTYTQESLTSMAANLDINKTNINLVGLSQTGIEYTPSLF